MSGKETVQRINEGPKQRLFIEVEPVTFFVLERFKQLVQQEEKLDYMPSASYVAGWLLDKDYGLQPDEDEEEKGGVIY